MEEETTQHLQSHFGGSFSHNRLWNAESDVCLYLEDDERNLKEYAMEKQKGKQANIPKRTRKEYER